MRSPRMRWQERIISQQGTVRQPRANFSSWGDEATGRATFAGSLIDFPHGQEKNSTQEEDYRKAKTHPEEEARGEKARGEEDCGQEETDSAEEVCCTIEGGGHESNCDSRASRARL